MKPRLILYNRPAEDASADETDVLDQVGFFRAGLQENGWPVEELALTADFRNEIFGINPDRYACAVNLVESVWGRDELLHLAPSILRLRNIPYTGCPAEALYLTGDKPLSKRLMQIAGIPVPAACRPSGWTSLEPGRTYILKPACEDGSVGITEDSVFRFDGERPDLLDGKNDANWFVEEYVAGREFNLSLLGMPDGPRLLPPAEIIFRNYPEGMPRIVSWKAKWDEDSFQYRSSVRTFGTALPSGLREQLHEICRRCWSLFGLRGYARIDLRIDAQERPFVLEVNANPCISPDSGFVAACQEAGLSRRGIIRSIIRQLN